MILSCKTKDAADKKPLPARVAIYDDKGKYYSSKDSFAYCWNGIEYFYTNGEFEVDVRPGKITLICSCGTEYQSQHQTLLVDNKKPQDLTLETERWIKPQKQGWYSGDPHIHGHERENPGKIDIHSVPQEITAEDLNIACIVDGSIGQKQISDKHIIAYGSEYRNGTYGHALFLNTKRTIHHKREGYEGNAYCPTGFELFQEVHSQNGIVILAHPITQTGFEDTSSWPGGGYGRGLPIYTALGVIDCIEVLSMSTKEYQCIDEWYRLLNCGFRIPASAGTDVCLGVRNYFPVGTYRTYTKIEREFSYQKWIDGLKAGQSFFTTGPVLFFKIGGHSVGSTIELNKPLQLTGQVEVYSPVPLERLEILENGQIIKEFNLNNKVNYFRRDFSIKPEKSSWFASRCVAKRKDGILEEHFAHTNPIYVQLGGARIHSPADSKYFLKWINRLEKFLERHSRWGNKEESARTKDSFDRARTVFKRQIHETSHTENR